MNSSCLEFIMKRCPLAHGKLHLEHFKDTIIAITSNDFVRRILFISTNQGKQKIDTLTILPSDEEIINISQTHLSNFIHNLISNNITAFFIFDNSLNVAEISEHSKLTSLCEYLRKICLHSEHHSIKIIESDTYAEEYARQLVFECKVNAVLSEEISCLAYGFPLILRYIDDATISWTQFDTILKDLGFNHTQFIDFLIMCGLKRSSNDIPLNTNMRGVGPVKSYKYICTNGSADYLLQVDKASCLNLSSLRDKFRL